MTGASHISNVWKKTTDLQVVSGHGCRVVDVNGVEYLDFTAGIAAASTGHSHPMVVQAI
ncbi:MAG: aminotransferase class III-fold pyridoxal phosphate-dependent enzyme, partial [Ilumatobacteraceae bacterium]